MMAGLSTHIHACVKKAARQLGLYMTQTMYRQIQYTVTPNNIYDVLTSLWHALMQIHPQGHMVKLSHFLLPAIPWSYCFLSGSRSNFLLSRLILCMGIFFRLIEKSCARILQHSPLRFRIRVTVTENDFSEF